jgi:hypothetical protein
MMPLFNVALDHAEATNIRKVLIQFPSILVKALCSNLKLLLTVIRSAGWTNGEFQFLHTFCRHRSNLRTCSIVNMDEISKDFFTFRTVQHRRRQGQIPLYALPDKGCRSSMVPCSRPAP